MKKILSEKGFSLIQSLIGVSLIAGASVMLMKVSQNSSQIQATTQRELQMQMIADVIAHNMSSPSACQNTLAKAKVGGTMLEEGVELGVSSEMALNSILDESGNVIFDTNTSFNEGIKISKIEVQRISTDRSQMKVTFTKEDNGRSMGGRDIAKQIPLTISYQDDTIKGCIVQFDDEINEANKSVCLVSGGNWDDSTKTCNNCGPGQIRRITATDPVGICRDPFVLDEKGICEKMGEKAFWSGSQNKCVVCGIGEIKTGASGSENCVSLIDSSNYASVSSSCKTSCNQKILLKLNTENKRYEYACEGEERCPASEESNPSGCKCVAGGADVLERAQYCFSDPQAQWSCEDQNHAVHGSYCGSGYPSVERVLPEPIDILYCEDDSIPTVKSYVEKYNSQSGYSTLRQRITSMSLGGGGTRPIKSQTIVSTCQQGTCGQTCAQLGYTLQNNVWRKEVKDTTNCPSSCYAQTACLTSGGFSCYTQIELPKAHAGTSIRIIYPGNHTGNYNQDCAPNGIWGAYGQACLDSYNGGYNGQTAYGRAFTEATYQCVNGSWNIMGGTGSGKNLRCLCSCSHFQENQPRANDWKNGCWGGGSTPLTNESTHYYSEYGEYSMCARDPAFWYNNYPGYNSGSGGGSFDRSDATQPPGFNACNNQAYPYDGYY